MKSSASLFLLLPFFLFSCKKQPVICTENCFSLNINGSAFNKLTNTTAPNVPLVVDRVKFIGIASSSQPVQAFSSDNLGIFNTTISIDSTMFRNGYFLQIRVKDNNDYITLPDKGEIRLYDLTNNTFKNLHISVYPKTNLTIKLNRNQTDNFQYFSVSYYFMDNQEFFPFSILSAQDITRSELVVPTTTDLFTKIRVTKRNSSGVSTSSIDSIQCFKNVNNIYTVNF